jgi:hypothetical protein
LTQPKNEQNCAADGWQAPMPSQVGAGMTLKKLPHMAAPQAVPAARSAQAPARHIPVCPQAACALAEQAPWGSGVPSATARHVPTLPPTLQAVHAPLQVVSQQTPCAQWVELHSEPALHDWPLFLSPHEPLRQTNPAAHSALVEQLAKHLVPVHTKGLQPRVVGVVHWPAALQVAPGV